MNSEKTSLKDALILTPRVFTDERGSFMESYNKEKILEITGTHFDEQDNQSVSHKGVFRGLHFQLPPYAQAKLVRVLKGKIYDVIVDIRKDSPTFGQWEGFELSAENNKQLYVPRGFAHGFVSLEDNTTMLYKVDGKYSKAHEGGLSVLDPALGITLPLATDALLINERDRTFPAFGDFSETNPFHDGK